MKLPWSRKEDLLDGLTILDFSALLPCPFAAQLFVELGARVIKIESPKRPDPARHFGTANQAGVSYAYAEVNRGKELVWLDLKDPASKDTLDVLVRQSHGGIQGFRPDAAKRLGLTQERLAAINPKFVICNVQGFYGSDPGRTNRAAHDIGFVARSGILDLTRDFNGLPVLPGVPLADISVAYSAALKLLAGILRAQTSGQGRAVNVTIEEALLDIQRPFLSDQLAQIKNGKIISAGKTLVTGAYPCYGIYKTNNGHITVGAIEAKFWQNFLNALGLPQLVHAQLAPPQSEANLTAKAAIQDKLITKSTEEWMSVFNLVDCCVEPVVTIKQLTEYIEVPSGI
jgi:crotonobetainyl-CoA:carnitine CoA-transferase CaiB-like acyl-CoA transferase